MDSNLQPSACAHRTRSPNPNPNPRTQTLTLTLTLTLNLTLHCPLSPTHVHIHPQADGWRPSCDIPPYPANIMNPYRVVRAFELSPLGGALPGSMKALDGPCGVLCAVCGVRCTCGLQSTVWCVQCVVCSVWPTVDRGAAHGRLAGAAATTCGCYRCQPFTGRS